VLLFHRFAVLRVDGCRTGLLGNKANDKRVVFLQEYAWPRRRGYDAGDRQVLDRTKERPKPPEAVCARRRLRRLSPSRSRGFALAQMQPSPALRQRERHPRRDRENLLQSFRLREGR